MELKTNLIRKINFSFELSPILKKFKNRSAILFVVFILSCAPQSKESYLEDYKKFINELAGEDKNYNEKEWDKMEEKYKKFSGEWREKFKDDFTLQEKITLKKYEAQFNFIKIKIISSGYFNELFN